SVILLCDFSPFGGLVKIIGGLQVHPELSGCSQRLGQIQSRISRHVPFALDQLIQTSSGPVEFLGKGCLCHARRLQKLFEKNFPWMKGVPGLFHGQTSFCSSMVIKDLNIVRVAIFPPENYPPLIIDTDRVKTTQFTFYSLQAVSRRHSKILQFSSIVQIQKLSASRPHEFRREPTDNIRMFVIEQILSKPIAEALNHCYRLS